MDSFEFNKLAGSILFGMLVLTGINLAGNALVAPRRLKRPVFVVNIPKEGQAQTAAAKPAGPSLPALLASTNVKKGESTAKVCLTCHTFEKGQPNKIGPNLWGIVGEKVAAVPNFSFSDAMQQLGQKGETWTYQRLFDFLENPQGYIKGTKMPFAGIKNDKQRADVVAFLRTLNDNPPPLPEPEAAPAATKAAPPAGAAATANPSPAPPSATAAAPGGAGAATAGGAEALQALLAKADLNKGKQTANICKTCHTFDKGGPNRIGPNLWGIVGEKVAAVPNYSFSDAMQKLGSTGKSWTPERLFAFLKDPQTYVKGTKMPFAGIKNDQTRADVVAFLRTLGDSPPAK